MSLKDKFKAINKGLGEGIGEAPKVGSEKPKTAPGQLLMYSDMVRQAQEKVETLEQRLKDVENQALPIDVIDPNPWQPRRVFDEADIRSLAESISEVGLIQPVIVRRKSVTSSDTLASTESVTSSDTAQRYELVAGERRLRAHRLLGSAEIKAIVIEVPNADMAVMALAENMDRKDLTEYEVAKAVRRAEKEFPSRTKLAEAIGRTRQDLYKYFAFDALPVAIKVDLDANPRLLGRNAAELIVRLIKSHGSKAEAALMSLWPRVVAGHLDQPRLPELLEASILRGETVKTERDIRKLFVGKEQAGSITRDSSALTVKIRAAALTPEKEAEIRSFIERILVS